MLFCCEGCRTVYLLLSESQLESYYRRDPAPGARPTFTDAGRFAYLDLPETLDQFLEFADGERARVTFTVPNIHCASCIWLLENLFRLEPGVIRSQAAFATRHLTILYDHRRISLRGVVELLARIGYEPDIRLAAMGEKPTRSDGWKLYAKIGVAGFAFANVMLFSLPEYFTSGGLGQGALSTTFRLASLILSLPVLLYSAQDYFRSAWVGLRRRVVNLDVPLALGIGMLFLRSAYDTLSGTGPGYFDSFTGLVFFLLLGRLFQKKTFDRLSFERDYRSYFPIACIRKNGSCEATVPITRLRTGDRIVVRHQELIPADSIVISGSGQIDYSFVTGESETQVIPEGQRVYAGGRQIGGAIELEVIREVSESRLVSLWSSDQFRLARRDGALTISDVIAKYFTAGILVIAAATAFYWSLVAPDRLPHAVTSVLIVACPCALALARPFALGTAMRLWGRRKLYMRSAEAIEAMSQIDHIIFDKTGTLTRSELTPPKFVGPALGDSERRWIASLSRHSTHPASRCIAASMRCEFSPVVNFDEVPGSGTSGAVEGHVVRLGRRKWASFGHTADDITSSQPAGKSQIVHVGIDGKLRGAYMLAATYREGLESTIPRLKGDYRLSILTGDTQRDEPRLRELFGGDVAVSNGQSPHDKLDHVSAMQRDGCRVLMVGDGLNDAGALRAATVGIAVTEDSSSFSPASDGILDAASLGQLPRFLRMATRCRRVVYWSFALSLTYNIIGLTYAASGHLSPLVSAILMPVSSVSVVVFATLATQWVARREGLG